MNFPETKPTAEQGLLLLNLAELDEAGALAALSAEERAEAGAISNPPVRRVRLASRWLRRTALAGVLDTAPAPLRFETGPHGQPLLADQALHFSISHSGDWLALYWHRRARVGVDLELISHPRNWGRLLPRYFSAAEQRACFEASGAPIPAQAVRYWTLKEAWLKGLGLGVYGGPAQTCFQIGDAQPGPLQISGQRPEGPGCWTFGLANPVAELQLAWAREADGPAPGVVRLTPPFSG